MLAAPLGVSSVHRELTFECVDELSKLCVIHRSIFASLKLTDRRFQF